MIAVALVLSLLVQKDPTASDASAAMVAAGSIAVYATVSNPTMYDVFVVSAASEQAGKAELRDGDKTISHITVPSFGSIELKSGGPFVLLSDLKSQLKAGDTVKLTLMTDGGIAIAITAVVR